jgi:hypothetical protein
MIVGNEEQVLYSIVARWAGSSHDNRVWWSSAAKDWIEHSGFMVAGLHFLHVEYLICIGAINV